MTDRTQIKETARICIELPRQYAKLLALWAENKKTTKTTLTNSVTQAQIEASEAQIMEFAHRNAADMGMPFEEYEAYVFEKHKLYEGNQE